MVTESFYKNLLYNPEYLKRFGQTLLDRCRESSNRTSPYGISPYDDEGNHMYQSIRISSPRKPDWDKNSGFTFFIKLRNLDREMTALSLFKMEGQIHHITYVLKQKEFRSLLMEEQRNLIIDSLLDDLQPR